MSRNSSQSCMTCLVGVMLGKGLGGEREHVELLGDLTSLDGSDPNQSPPSGQSLLILTAESRDPSRES